MEEMDMTDKILQQILDIVSELKMDEDAEKEMPMEDEKKEMKIEIEPSLEGGEDEEEEDKKPFFMK